MKMPTLIALVLSLAPLTSNAVPVRYYVEHVTPDLTVKGTFTIDVGTAFGRYYASEFAGIAETEPWDTVYFDADAGNNSLLWIRWVNPTSNHTIGVGWVEAGLPGTSAIEKWESLVRSRSLSIWRLSDVPDAGPSSALVVAVFASMGWLYTVQARSAPGKW